MRGSGAAAVRGLLVDLDDTLYDHRAGVRGATAALRHLHPGLARLSAAEVRRRYDAILEEISPRVVLGQLSVAQGRRERLRRLLEGVGEEVPGTTLDASIQAARAAYRAAEGPVRGAATLLRQLRPRWRVIVVSNNRRAEQLGKLRRLGLLGAIDGLVTLEEVGVAKPDPAMFRAGVTLSGLPARRCAVLGDSWERDVRGAQAARLPVLWLDREGRGPSTPGVPWVRSLSPARPVVQTLERLVAGPRAR